MGCGASGGVAAGYDAAGGVERQAQRERAAAAVARVRETKAQRRASATTSGRRASAVSHGRQSHQAPTSISTCSITAVTVYAFEHSYGRVNL